MYELLLVGPEDELLLTSRPFTISQKLDTKEEVSIPNGTQLYVEVRRNGSLIIARSVPFYIHETTTTVQAKWTYLWYDEPVHDVFCFVELVRTGKNAEEDTFQLIFSEVFINLEKTAKSLVPTLTLRVQLNIPLLDKTEDSVAIQTSQSVVKFDYLFEHEFVESNKAPFKLTVYAFDRDIAHTNELLIDGGNRRENHYFIADVGVVHIEVVGAQVKVRYVTIDRSFYRPDTIKTASDVGCSIADSVLTKYIDLK